MTQKQESKRETGYYWVKIVTGWRIFMWYGDHWATIGGLATFEDKDLSEINETRIPPPIDNE